MQVETNFPTKKQETLSGGSRKGTRMKPPNLPPVLPQSKSVQSNGEPQSPMEVGSPFLDDEVFMPDSAADKHNKAEGRIHYLSEMSKNTYYARKKSLNKPLNLCNLDFIKAFNLFSRILGIYLNN